MYCEKCHYGSPTCRMTKCPHCGCTKITTERPFKPRVWPEKKDAETDMDGVE